MPFCQPPGENLDTALREASEVVERLEREVESLSLRGESLKRERDAWKRVARGNGPADPGAPSASAGEERLPAELMPARVDEELLKQLEERAQEASRLRDELAVAQREGARLGAQLAKAGAQVAFQEGAFLAYLPTWALLMISSV
jgi:phage shock protein A